MNFITQYFISRFRPWFLGRLTKLLYSGRNVKIGKSFKVDSIPKIIIDKGSSIYIGDCVQFRRSVEIRAHKVSILRIGDRTRIDRGVRLLSTNDATIDIGENVRIGLYTVLNGGASISIGQNVLISGFVYLQTSMHVFKHKFKAVNEQGYDHAPIGLDEDVWLGTHVVIHPGVNVGRGGIVGSNAVVNKSVLAYQIVAGVPAKVIKDR